MMGVDRDFPYSQFFNLFTLQLLMESFSPVSYSLMMANSGLISFCMAFICTGNMTS
jgi:hypothetical protein